MVKRFPDLKKGSKRLGKMLSVRVLDLAAIRVGDVICGRGELHTVHAIKKI